MARMPTENTPFGAKLAPYAAALVVALSTAVNLRFVLASGEKPAYAPHMTADATSFVRNAEAMIRHGAWLYTPDTYHSVGASVYVAAFLRVFHSLLAVKIGHVVLLAVSLVLFHRLARSSLGDARGAALGVALLGSSALLSSYCGIVQYEIVVLFLFVVLLTMTSSERRLPWLVGMVGAVAATFRVHFGLFFVFYLLDVLIRAHRAGQGTERSRQLRDAALALGGFLVVAVPFNLHFAARSAEPFFFQSRSSGARWFTRLNPNATGVLWPYPARAEPHGLAFVLERPGDYVRLLGQKVLFLVGVTPDVVHVESHWVRAFSWLMGAEHALVRTAFGALYGASAAVGWLVVVFDRATRRERPLLALAAMQVAAVLLPQAVVGSSTRILVPIVPALLLLQLHLAQRGLALIRGALAQKSV